MADCGYGDRRHNSETVPHGESRDAPAVPAKHQRDVKTERVGLLSLSRELRDKIYDHLLRIERWDVLKYKRDLFKVDLSILRVNQQLHQEASEIFYEGNTWVCITIEPSLLEALCNEWVAGRKGFPGDKPVSLATYTRTAPVAAATVTLQRLPQSGPGINLIHLLVSSFAVPRLCRILTVYANVRGLDIRVHLNALTAGKVKRAWHESLLDSFKDARGFGRATISDAQGNSPHVELATLMMSPFKHFQEIIDRASEHHDRARQKEELGRLSEARYGYQGGYDFTLWFDRSTHQLGFSTRIQYDGELGRSYIQLRTKLAFSCAFLCIKLGDLDLAYPIIERMLSLPPIDEHNVA
ncbi:hypothetical protein HO133_004110 [Letharia lupina]|uniref:Uncharacterized protein n=1 Tax=Letharia lupina TaxID=560253 RepID=A0A8H6CAK6_9LECA|nr:uncharacterized protein HO133_004110 [Letharia lupina]KAF6219641.1 hypothetical protein HO133_004110 [Letharia lupina]